MDDNKEEKKTRVLKEMERKSQDIIKVFNPQSKDHTFMYDARHWVVPAKDKDLGYGKGCLDTPRYIANHYIKHTIDRMINDENEKRLKPFREESEKKGEFWPEKEERMATKSNNPEARSKYLKILWKGVVREFAITEAPLDVAKPLKKDDRPLDEQLIEDMEDVVEAPLYVAKKDRKDPKQEFAQSIK